LRKLFDNKPKKKLKPSAKNKKLKIIKPKREYRATYNDLYSLPDDKLDWYADNGFPEEQDMARGIRSERKRMKLAIYGY
jgi:hypothetical protein